jgi:predicted ATP-binding protein involved in virulence
LSTGFVAIIKIFQEVIAGYGGWVGLHDEKNIQHVDGVVFIDELESHLHPRWQHKFIPLLKEFFPNTTFYVATHSPLIVSTTDEGEAYELIREGDTVTAKKLGNPKEWYLADVFSQGFHVDSSEFPKGSDNRKASLAERLQKFSVLVKDYTKQKDEKLKDEIERLYQAILPSLVEDDPRRRSLDYLKGLVK